MRLSSRFARADQHRTSSNQDMYNFRRIRWLIPLFRSASRFSQTLNASWAAPVSVSRPAAGSCRCTGFLPDARCLADAQARFGNPL